MIDFFIIARELGYNTAKEMFEDMYVEKGLSLVDIGILLGVNRNTVTRQIRLLGLPVSNRGGSHPTGHRFNEALESIPVSRQAKARIATLARQLSLSPSTVYEYLRKKGRRRLAPQHDPHPGYSRKKGEKTPRPDAIRTVLDALAASDAVGQLLEVEENGQDADDPGSAGD